MDCWKEGEIEWAASRIVEGESSPDIDALIAHARECARCGELLGLFEGVERGIRRDLPAARIHPLVRLRTESPHPSAWSESPTPAEFDVAAETAKSASISEMTLSTEDGGYIVRIFRIGGEAGARAVLVFTTDATARVSLMVDGVAYAFDDSGIVEIPEFPASEIQLAIP